jgi:hypothetical protein
MNEWSHHKAVMASVSETWRNHWKDVAQRALGKRHVVLVEGDDDRDLVESALSARRPAWPAEILVVTCGGRDKVVDAVAEGKLPGGGALEAGQKLHGLLDRDLWTESEGTDLSARHGALHITPGWCIENTWLNPALLARLPWLTDAAETLQEAMEPTRELWVRSGALWTVLQRHQNDLRRLGQSFRDGQNHKIAYGAPLGGLPLDHPTQLEGALLASGFSAAGAHLSAAGVARTAFDLAEERLRQAPADQWLRFVHGKRAFPTTMVTLLNQHIGQRDTKTWRRQLAPLLVDEEPVRELLRDLLGASAPPG